MGAQQGCPSYMIVLLNDSNSKRRSHLLLVNGGRARDEVVASSTSPSSASSELELVAAVLRASRVAVVAERGDLSAATSANAQGVPHAVHLFFRHDCFN